MDYSFLIYLAPVAGLVSVGMAVFLAARVLRQDAGTDRMREIAAAIQEGAMAYLKRQYMTIGVVAVVIAVVIVIFLDWRKAVAFVVGAVASGAAGFIGMNVSVRANVRTAAAARTSLKAALNVAFRGGAVTGLAVVGLSMMGVSLSYIIFRDVDVMIGFGLGASLISLFARIGGGIYTKAADVGADIVGKVEEDLPEDDPRNPATIADNVGDNVGDCAGMGADLFETYAVTLLAAMLIGAMVAPQGPDGHAMFGDLHVVYPVALCSAAIISSIVGIFFVRLGKTNHIMNALYKGVYSAAAISAIAFACITRYMYGSFRFQDFRFFWVALVGIVITILMFMITEYYTGTEHRPVKAVARASHHGAGTNVITGLAMGMESTILPVITIVVGILAAYYLAGGPHAGSTGLYGIAIAAVAMLSTAGMIVALDSYGPITDNAGGIAEMSELPEEVRAITDELDGVGNTTKAVTKGYAIGSAALGALALFSDYYSKMMAAAPVNQKPDLSINNPAILIGLLIGGLLPFAFSAVTMQAVSKAAMSVVIEVRRQFKEFPGILKGEQRPDYAKAVDIVTGAALREMILPGAMAIVTPIVVGVLLGAAVLPGLLIGIIVVGFMLALTLNNAGGAWDNAKKMIETEGLYGGKGSDAHKASVVGDTVGDPTKDTSGPGLNALIKVVNMVAILFITVFPLQGLLGVGGS